MGTESCMTNLSGRNSFPFLKVGRFSLSRTKVSRKIDHKFSIGKRQRPRNQRPDIYWILKICMFRYFM